MWLLRRVGERGTVRGFFAGWVIGISWMMSARVDAADPSTPAKPLNVILISLDTVRPDHLSCYGYRRKTTPNIDRLAEDGVIFTQAFSQAPNTFPSHLSILTSRYPQRHWIVEETAVMEPSTEALAESLKRQGYTTGAFVGFDNSSGRLIRLLTSRPLLTFDRVYPGVVHGPALLRENHHCQAR